MNKFQPISGIDALKIDIANNFGKDKLTFKERINWFNKELKPKIEKFTSDIALVAMAHLYMAEEKELAVSGLIAYKEYLNQEYSSHMVSFDATASGIQLMSALMGDYEGMVLSNLVDDQRHDAYSEIYEILKKVWVYQGLGELSITRKEIKQAIMVMMYGGSTSIMKYLNNDDQLFEALMACCKASIKGAHQLCEILLDCTDEQATSYSWITPDNFHVKTDILVQYQEERDTPVGRIQVKYKDLGTSKYYKGNVANVIHSLDATLMREVVARCHYDIDTVMAAILRMEKVINLTPEHVVLLSKAAGSSMNQELTELAAIYKATGFVSVRCLNYIQTNSDVIGLILHTPELIQELYKLATKMVSYQSFDLCVVHDCFRTSPNNINYIRYWYKEVIAEFIEADALKFILRQLPNGAAYADKLVIDKSMANLVRNSNYAIC